jgi:hypothetical protein
MTNKNPKPKAPKKTVFRYLDKNPVRIATSNLFIDTEGVPVDYMVGVIFNEIGGQELINYSMTDLSGEENVSPIKDIYNINERFSPFNILPTNRSPLIGNAPTAAEPTLNLLEYTPNVSDETSFVLPPSAPSRDVVLSNPNLYIDATWQNVLINLEDLAEGLLLELDFARFGETISKDNLT